MSSYGQRCCAGKAQDVKEAAKKPGQHKRSWGITLAVTAVAIGIYLVRCSHQGPHSILPVLPAPCMGMLSLHLEVPENAYVTSR